MSTRMRTSDFTFQGHTFVYDEYGTGPRVVVLLHGVLLSRHMHQRLAAQLAGQGYRVICLDLLGHGGSDAPRDLMLYSMPLYARQVVALLDHLGVKDAIVGGTSLGANVSLETASQSPGRVRGMLLEMPVLDNALLACAVFFTPILLATTFGAPITGLVAKAARRVPRRLGPIGDIFIETLSMDPGPASAILQGVFFGRVAPPRDERVGIKVPALVIGHPRDPIHPFSDADMLMRELPNVRMAEASSILEMRLRPERLFDEISSFIDAQWPKRVAKAGKKPARRTPSKTRPVAKAPAKRRTTRAAKSA